MRTLTIDGLHEADTLLLGLLLAREAQRTGDAQGFLDLIETLLAPLLFTQEGGDAFAYRLQVARLLLETAQATPADVGTRTSGQPPLN